MAPRKRGLQFVNSEDFQRALSILDDLASQGPLEYSVAPKRTIVLVEWSYYRVLPIIQEHSIPYTEVRVRSMSDLSPEEQVRLRGWNRQEGQGP
jgi:hypothetical protein